MLVQAIAIYVLLAVFFLLGVAVASAIKDHGKLHRR